MVQWEDYVVALVYGTLSALTLPMGALMGIFNSDASQDAIALSIAFGAGALLFAMTVELYGNAMEHLEMANYAKNAVIEVLVTLGGAVVGAGLYIMLCREIDRVVSVWEEGEDNAEQVPMLYDKVVVGVPPDSRASSLPNSAIPSPRHRSQSPHSAAMPTRGRKKAVLGALSRDARVSSHQTTGEPGYGSTADEETKRGLRKDCGGRLEDLRVAGSIWLGVLLDGIPEAIMLGFLAAEHKLSLALVMALLISNLPESFSSAALLKRRDIPNVSIISMWTFLCAFTGIVACLTAYFLPDDMVKKQTDHYKQRYIHLKIIGALIEGMAGGAMLACISNVMLPDAFRRRGDMVGMFVLAGFIVATLVKVFGGVVKERWD